jgi:hypothetical protein
MYRMWWQRCKVYANDEEAVLAIRKEIVNEKNS